LKIWCRTSGGCALSLSKDSIAEDFEMDDVITKQKRARARQTTDGVVKELRVYVAEVLNRYVVFEEICRTCVGLFLLRRGKSIKVARFVLHRLEGAIDAEAAPKFQRGRER
jgi:hypothetical protein